VARLTIRHDGGSYGCAGVCRTPEDVEGPPLAPWTEIALLCADHAATEQEAISNDTHSAVTCEDLS
jgi:hypothetical protein